MTIDPALAVIIEDHQVPVAVPVIGKHHMAYPELPASFIIEGDNYHALAVLSATHEQKIDAIFIDPPYNTGTTRAYKNNIEKEQWIQLMSSRLLLARNLLATNGVICISIGKEQLFNLGNLADDIFGDGNRLGVITVVHNKGGRSQVGFSRQPFNDDNEFYLFYAKNAKEASINPPTTNDDSPSSHPRKFQDERGRFYWKSFTRTGGNSRPADRPRQHYPIHVNPKTGHMAIEPFDDSIELWPIDSDDEARIWNGLPSYFEKMFSEDRLGLFPSHTKDGDFSIRYKCYARGNDGDNHIGQPMTTWTGKDLNAREHGTKLLRMMIGPNPFNDPKSVYAVKRALHAMVGHKPEATVLDFYAGSGTTAHALLMLNAEDGGNRRFILAQINEPTIKGLVPICEEICLPRVRAAIDGYNKGKKHVPGLPGNIRYLRVELVPTHHNREQMMMNLYGHDRGLIQLAEGVGSDAERSDTYSIHGCHDGTTVAILDAPHDYHTVLRRLGTIPGRKVLYVPSTLDQSPYSEPEDVIVKTHPFGIVNQYARLWPELFRIPPAVNETPQ